MPKLRLGLSLSSIKRIFADVVTDDGFRILTQSLDSIISQRGEFFVTQEADVSADFVVTKDPLITQDGNFITLQNPLHLMVIEQDFETTGDRLIAENAQGLLTQDGLTLITQKQFR
tara:strand:+ start:245 stop:592 length:348 start_codon:yes stop_codon:yes gene_type:complete